MSCPALTRFLERLAGLLPAADADSVAVCLVSDRKMREYNRVYRDTDATTDVLSFPGGESPAPIGERHLGDILICVPRARSQARDGRHSLARELKLLALHGYLHLLGYDHEADDGTMMRLQRRMVRRLIDPPRAERQP